MPKTSPLWQYFEKILRNDEKNESAICKICQKSVSLGGKGKTANTSNMKYHLLKNHPVEYSQITDSGKVASLETETGNCAPSTSNQSNIRIQLRQQKPQISIKTAFENIRQWDINSEKAKEIHKLIGEMIATDNQPFSICSDTGFTRLLKKGFPLYSIPSDKYFRETVVPDIFQKCKSRVQKIIDDEMIGKMSLTSDIWTCQHNNCSFISLTAHFWNKNVSSHRESFVLACRGFPGTHTGDTISEMLQDLLDQWKLKKSQIHLLLADNASNMKKGIVGAIMKYQGCFVHTLQLTIKDSIDCQRAVIDVIAKARRIVTHFNHSATACDKLKKLQEQMNVPTKKLIQDIQTRWNSTYYMLERLLEQKKVISIYILDNPDLTDLTFHQWDLVQKLTNLLQPFEEITKLSSNRECCISEVIPLVKTLDSYLSNRSKSAIFSGVDTLRSDLQKNLEKRFNHIFTEESFTLATLLDPRFKNSFFDNEGGPIYEILKRKITVQEGGSGIIETITDGESDGEDNMPLVKLLAMERDSGASKSVHDLFWESYEHFAGEGTSGSSKRKRKQRSAFVEVLDDEIKLYQSHPIISRNKNPVQWWNDNKLRFPNLFPQAAIYLSAPAGSVPSEQVFSEAGNIYDAKRSRLTPDRAESLLFLHHNLPKLNYQY